MATATKRKKGSTVLKQRETYRLFSELEKVAKSGKPPQKTDELLEQMRQKTGIERLTPLNLTAAVRDVAEELGVKPTTIMHNRNGNTFITRQNNMDNRIADLEARVRLAEQKIENLEELLTQ